MKNELLILVTLTTVAVTGCQRESTPPNTVAVVPGIPSPMATAITEEPLYEGSPKRFREAWMAFTKDGTYRMARTKEVAGMPYHYSFAHDVLVIVVEQNASGDSRLKLAYFKAADRGNGAYKLYWVDHNFHLADTRVSNASSDLVLYEGGDPARRSAFLKWDAKRRRYTCLAT